MTGALTSVALAGGLLVGATAVSAAETTSVSIDRPNPFRCDRAEQGLDAAKRGVAGARARLKAAPRSKKPAMRAALKAAKQRQMVAQERVTAYC